MVMPRVVSGWDRPGVRRLTDGDIEFGGRSRIVEVFDEFFVGQREPRGLAGRVAVFGLGGELELLGGIAVLEVDHRFGGGGGHRLLGGAVEQVNRDRTRRVIVDDFGVVLLVPEFDEGSVMWAFGCVAVVIVDRSDSAGWWSCDRVAGEWGRRGGG